MPILSELILYPIKSCGGVALREAIVTRAGLMTGQLYDREWMVVDADGKFLTQRECPQMALIKPHIKADTLELRAPGMLSLEIPLALPEPGQVATIEVQIWNDRVNAYDCGDTTALWFTTALDRPCRLVRFHTDAKRLASSEWTGGIEAPTLFPDGYPILVISQASLDELNEKLIREKRPALPMNRFRPNIVIGGIDAFEEDYAETITVNGAVLKPVKPCPRCPIPSVDQDTGHIGPDPLDILRIYRTNPKLGGAITFGMNAILLAGEGSLLRVGQEVEVALAF